MDLTHLNDRPELAVAIGGREYRFSEVPIGRLADLQDFLRRTLPHPIDAIKPHLDGLAAADRQSLLEAARREGRSWPPQAGTAAGTAALLATEAGQVEALFAGLSVHHAGLSREDAARLYHQLGRDAARAQARAARLHRQACAAARREGRPAPDPPAADEDGAARRIFSVIFGMGDPALDDGELPLPEACAPGPDRSTGG